MYNSSVVRTSEIYTKGVSTFLKVAEANRRNVGSKEIWCPCMSLSFACKWFYA
ncbi:putative Transposase-associated domain-containing protein [Helianthus annuus]|nr:putative Transposase-associated domain-containing protein [Helianthus annuus]KAJ0951320.1 putative Transposase-associated domain-containing protein [Helianthus annuus]